MFWVSLLFSRTVESISVDLKNLKVEVKFEVQLMILWKFEGQ